MATIIPIAGKVEMEGKAYVLISESDYKNATGVLPVYEPNPESENETYNYMIHELINDIILERRRQELTQSELAEMSGVKQATISKMENGKVKPTSDTLNKLMLALGLLEEGDELLD